MTVHHEKDFIDTVQLGDQLGSLEGCERLACASCVPDVSVLICVLDTFQYLLDSVVLIRTKDHQAFITFVKDNVFADNLAQYALVKEVSSKLAKIINGFVIWKRPVEGKLVATVRIISKITGIYAIGDYKELDIIEQAAEGGLLVALNLVISSLCLL